MRARENMKESKERDRDGESERERMRERESERGEKGERKSHTRSGLTGSVDERSGLESEHTVHESPRVEGLASGGFRGAEEAGDAVGGEGDEELKVEPMVDSGW